MDWSLNLSHRHLILFWRRGTAIVVKTVFAAIATLPNVISEVAVGTAGPLPRNVANSSNLNVADYAVCRIVPDRSVTNILQIRS